MDEIREEAVPGDVPGDVPETTTRRHSTGEPLRRRVSRQASAVSKRMASGAASFLGVDHDTHGRQSFNRRRMKYCSKKAGGLRPEYMLPPGTEDVVDGIGQHPVVDPLRRHEGGPSRQSSTAYSQQTSQRAHRKDSVMKMTFDGIQYLVMGKDRYNQRKTVHPTHKRSFPPSSLTDSVPTDARSEGDVDSDVFFDQTPASVDDRGKTTGDVGGGRPGMSRISGDQMIRQDETDGEGKRQVGMGLLGRLLNRQIRTSVKESDHVKDQLDDFDDYRPYFTWWVTTVQVLICILSVAIYGFGPIGVGHRHKTASVMKPSLSVEDVGYFEPENFWIGPSSQSLIHLGAKYAPCMRRDRVIWDIIEEKRAEENTTACCVRNDGGGCMQTLEKDCPAQFSRWLTWSRADTDDRPTDGRSRGSVCGQDPRVWNCEEPPSSGAHAWPDDLTKWPICLKSVGDTKQSVLDHMSCTLIGRPCCTGIKGECIITTQEYCSFVNGYFHEEATLCSQVSCLDEICGMIAFLDPNEPDQFYRLFTSLFLHAGLVHCLVTVIFQMFLMRDMEKFMGPVRIGIIYIVSGVAGNLASAIFLPYRAEVGPAGSQFGFIATFFVEVIQSWQMLKYPWRALLKLAGLFVLLLVVGFLPWVDNYSHCIGFLFGLLLSFVLLPYVSFGEFDRRRKIITVVGSLVFATALFVLLVVLFYIEPLYDCDSCGYFNCIPFTDTFCQNFDIRIID